MGILKGDLVGRAAWDRHQDILDQLGFNLVRMLTRNDLNNLANRSDTTGIAGADLRSFFRADLIMEVTGDDDSPQYVAMEASYTADERDTDRVMRNCRFMQQFTDRPAHGVISSLRNDHHVESLVNDRVVHWFQLAERDPPHRLILSQSLRLPPIVPKLYATASGKFPVDHSQGPAYN